MKNKFKQISFIGFGLINSSLARVVKKNSLANKILAYSRTKDTRIKIENLNMKIYPIFLSQLLKDTVVS